jgi:dihydrofolate reductase
MDLTLIAAVDQQNAIGKGGGMPWHLPADLAHFKFVTWGKPVVMGRKTFDSIGKPLRGRTNIVITRDTAWRHDGVVVAHSLAEALAAAGKAAEVVVIGGAQLYAEALPQATRIHLTRIHATFDADTFFPALDMKQWREVSRHDHAADARNPHAYSFTVLERSS